MDAELVRKHESQSPGGLHNLAQGVNPGVIHIHSFFSPGGVTQMFAGE